MSIDSRKKAIIREGVDLINRTISEESLDRELLIHGGVELLARTIREESPNADIKVSPYGKFRDFETQIFGDENGELTAKRMVVQIGAHTLWLIVHDDTCIRARKGKDAEKNRHVLASIVQFEGPAIIAPEDFLIEPINNGSYPSFLVGTLKPEEGLGPGEPSYGFFCTLEREFRSFLRKIQLGKRGDKIRFKGAGISFTPNGMQ